MSHHLLIADDEPSILAVLHTFFERRGYRVTCAHDGQEAVDCARQARPDLIILDIQMPRKTGLAAVAELRGEPYLAATPVIALTAHMRDIAPDAILQAGFSHAMAKPFMIFELEEIVAEFCEGAIIGRNQEIPEDVR